MTDGGEAAAEPVLIGSPGLTVASGARSPVGIILPLIIAGAGGLLLALSYAQEPVWWAAWLAPGFLLAAALLASGRWRSWAVLAAGLIGGSTSFQYHASVIDSWAVAFVVLLGRALLWTWMIGAAARAAGRWHSSVAVFVLPVLAAAAETTIGVLSPHGWAGSYAYSQMDLVPLIQIASVGGCSAILAVVMLGASALGLVVARGFGWRGRGSVVHPAALAGVIVSGTVIFGLLRLAGATAPANGPEVALIAQDVIGGAPDDIGLLWRSYGATLNREARPGRIIVVPEALRTLSEPAAGRAAGAIAGLARLRRVTIIAGFIVDRQEGRTNRALVASADGSVRWYDKQHLVPASEGFFRAGHEPLVVEVGGRTIGVAICKDMHFPALGREYGVRGAQVMLVPANDFTVDAWMASRMSALRGIESGYAIARAARHGRSSVTDRYGRFIAEQSSGSQISTLVSRLPSGVDDTPTFYARFGFIWDWFWIVSGALLVWRLPRSAARGSRFRR